VLQEKGMQTMNIGAMLQETGAIDSIARELGVDQQTARTVAGALLPAIVGGLGRVQAGAASGGNSSGGLADVLGGMLGGSGGGLGGILLDQVLKSEPTPVQSGNDILGEIFGSKDVSRGVAEEVAGSTGISADLIKKMLPILAMAVVGYMLKQGSGQERGGNAGGALSGALGGLVGSIVQGMIRR
jgi:hypothetical protein